MKKQILILVMSLMALTVMAEKTKKEVTFNVPLDCQNCVAKVEKNIAFEKGVKAISCDLAAKTVSVSYLEEKTTIENLKKGFAKIGYNNVTVVGDKCCESTKANAKCCSSKSEEKCEGHDHKKTDKDTCSDKKSDCDSKCANAEKQHQTDKTSECCKK